MYCAYDSDFIIGEFEKYAGHEAAAVDKDSLVDYFGVRIPIAYAQYLAPRAGSVIQSPPFPGDTFRASFVEYIAVVESIRECGSVYQMAEIGASYAPFSVICAKLALRKGVGKIVLRPVEASQSGIESINGNFRENSLLTENVDMRVLRAAVVGDYKGVYFPDVNCTVDNGAAPQDKVTDVDVRGASLQLVKTPGVPFSFVISSFRSECPIDLLHIDIQGSEKSALPPAINSFSERVKRVMLATHSRPIEGQMMELFHNAGWRLIAEEPCEFNYREDLPAIEGMTIKDGSQYWVNPLFI